MDDDEEPLEPETAGEKASYLSPLWPFQAASVLYPVITWTQKPSALLSWDPLDLG